MKHSKQECFKSLFESSTFNYALELIGHIANEIEAFLNCDWNTHYITVGKYKVGISFRWHKKIMASMLC